MSRNAIAERFFLPRFELSRILLSLFLLAGLHAIAFAQSTNISTSDDGKTLVVGDAGESEIIAFGKNVVVKGRAKLVFAFGGNVTVEGFVETDVATVGGSVFQKENATIGGEVIVLGGTYVAESKTPLRTDGKETVVIGVFEDELRDFAQNPSAILSPTLSWGFVAQRLLSVLFWFVITFAMTTVSPGGISRAVARFQLSAGKVIGLGMAGLIGTSIGIGIVVNLLPGYLGGTLGLMMLFLLILSYFFGRVALQVSLGKFLQKHLIPESHHSETLGILLGVVGWTAILSVPYLWTVALIVLFSASIGLVLTARKSSGWGNS